MPVSGASLDGHAASIDGVTNSRTLPDWQQWFRRDQVVMQPLMTCGYRRIAQVMRSLP
jgi:hypothetical protein